MSMPPPPTTNPYWAIDQAAGAAAGVDPVLLSDQQWYESGWNPSARSPAGAEGIAQFMPATAADAGIDPLVPAEAIPAEADMLASFQRQFGSWNLALAAYNAGPGAVEAAGGIPANAQTPAYVTEIMDAWDNQGASGAQTSAVETSASHLPPPLSWVQGIVGGAVSGAGSAVVKGGVFLLFLGAGVALVVAGAYRVANPGSSLGKALISIPQEA